MSNDKISAISSSTRSAAPAKSAALSSPAKPAASSSSSVSNIASPKIENLSKTDSLKESKPAEVDTKDKVNLSEDVNDEKEVKEGEKPEGTEEGKKESDVEALKKEIEELKKELEAMKAGSAGAAEEAAAPGGGGEAAPGGGGEAAPGGAPPVGDAAGAAPAADAAPQQQNWEDILKQDVLAVMQEKLGGMMAQNQGAAQGLGAQQLAGVGGIQGINAANGAALGGGSAIERLKQHYEQAKQSNAQISDNLRVVVENLLSGSASPAQGLNRGQTVNPLGGVGNAAQQPLGQQIPFNRAQMI